MANTTWNPSDKTAGVTLSGGNLTAANASGNEGVRAIDSKTTGKFYFEVTMNAANVNYGVGFTNASGVLGSIWNTPIAAAIVYSSGSFWVNNANTGISLPSFSSGGLICCLAVDIGGRLLWARNGAAGNWNANSSNNPATGVGGINIASVSGAVFPLAAFTPSSGNCTANFGDTTFSGGVPGGFISGWASGAAVSAGVAAMVLA